MCPANERRRYSVMSSLIGWAHTQNNPCIFAQKYDICPHALVFEHGSGCCGGIGRSELTTRENICLGSGVAKCVIIQLDKLKK